MHASRWIVCGLLMAACTDANEFEALYDAPSAPSTTALTGTWGGVVEGFDTRWVLSPAALTLANKCGDTIVGVTVAAEISATSIRILQSKRAEDESCFVNAAPGTFTSCPTVLGMPKIECFVHAGKQLTIYANDVSFVALTKIEN